MKSSISSALLAATLMASAQAQIMLDFGPTTPTGGNLTNSPGHVSGAIAGSLTSWNVVGTADITAGSVLNANGTTATGVSVNLGSGSNAVLANLTSIGLGSQPSSSSTLGSQTNTVIYAGDSVGKDGIFNSSGQNFTATGFQIGGLAAGTYDVYLTMRNTSSNAAYYQTGWLGKSASPGDFNFSAYGNATVNYVNGATAISSWSENANYVKLSVTLGAGEVLNLAVTGGPSTATEYRGFLNSAQIVAIPEPSTWALIGASLAMVVVFRRRRLA